MSRTIVSVSRGADLVRRDRQTLYNHRKQGKLSFVRREDDSYGVDIAELQRVYGKLHMTAAELDESKNSESNSTDSATITALRHQLELVTQENQHLAKMNETWESRFNEAASKTKMIEHQNHQMTEKNREKEESWKTAMAERKDEIDQARAEAAEARESEKANAIKLASIASLGRFDRLFKWKAKVAS